MLNENLKTMRMQKGMSQEIMAERLNVVRQTVSKWEKGLSVPDAEMLTRIADLFEVSVGDLLGANIKNESEVNEIAAQLALLNEYLANKVRRRRNIWKWVLIVIVAIVLLFLIFLMILTIYV